jgi:predicted transposase YdaD
MGITYKSKFVEGWYQQGRAVGAAEGKAEGIAEGEARAILRVLKSRGLRPTLAQRELIESCDDVAQLDTWCDRALTATTVAMVFED